MFWAFGKALTEACAELWCSALHSIIQHNMFAMLIEELVLYFKTIPFNKAML